MSKHLVSGGLCQNWEVFYAEKQVCAVRNTTAVFLCSFTYPTGTTVEEVKWAYGESTFFYGPFIYDSKNNSSKLQYTGDKKSNCSLKIPDVEHKDAGHYAFRFITQPENQFTGAEGPVLQVTGRFCLTSFITAKS